MTRVPTDGELAVSAGVPSWSLRTPTWASWRGAAAPRIRLIIDNDFAGDPDDLPQLVHHLLSPSADIRAIVCSRTNAMDPVAVGPSSADDSLRVAHDVLRRMGLTDADLIVRGSREPLADRFTPARSPAVDAILVEAAAADTRPLLYVAGGGLTELASAVLIDPSITERMTVIWIGGVQHDDIVGTRGRFTAEYNRDIDLAAAQVVFDAGFDLWQVPRDLYRKCIVSEAELRRRVADGGGTIGQYVYDEIRVVLDELAGRIGRLEAYPLGDSPLVLLSVLQDARTDDDDFSSNAYVVKPTPSLADDGTYLDRPGARPMRVYTDLDYRLMFEDFYAKLAAFAGWQASHPGHASIVQ